MKDAHGEPHLILSADNVALVYVLRVEDGHFKSDCYWEDRYPEARALSEHIRALVRSQLGSDLH